MAFGGLFRRMTSGLELMRCKEGSLFNYTSGIGDHGRRWTCWQRYRANPDVEHWQNAIDAPGAAFTCPAESAAVRCSFGRLQGRQPALAAAVGAGLPGGWLSSDRPRRETHPYGLLNDAKQVARRATHRACPTPCIPFVEDGLVQLGINGLQCGQRA